MKKTTAAPLPKIRVTEICRREGTEKGRARLYVFPKGENIIQNLQNRRSRPINIYRGAARVALGVLGLNPETKLSWSQKAGCRCGCSPGFIITDSSLYCASLFCTVEVVGDENAAKVADTPEAIALAADRAMAIGA